MKTASARTLPAGQRLACKGQDSLGSLKGTKISPHFNEILNSAFKSLRPDARMKMIRAFLADESGATAIEYGLIAAGISLAIIAAVNGLGTNLKTKYTTVN